MLSVVSAHSIAGLTDICYTKDGSHFLTCGQDGDIHVFETKSDQVEHIRCADQCHCLVVHEYHVFIGTNRNELEVRSFPHGDSLPSLVHFTQPVSALCLSNSLLFIGTRDFKCVMMNLNDDSNKMKHFDGHQAPILSLNVYEEKRWLATSCCDGSIRIFNIDKQTLIKQLSLIQKSNDIETAVSLVKLDWDKKDQMLAIPVKNTIQFFESEKWTRKKTYENDSIDEAINLIRFSPCGTLFVVAYVNGQLAIINRLTFDICMNYSSKDAVCSLAWNPIESTRFTCSTMAGEYAHVDVSEYLSKPTSTPSDKLDLGAEEEEEMEEVVDELESNSNDVEMAIDDKEVIPKWFERASSMLTETKPIELQEPFQSTSTSKYLESRFLLWNNIGAITCYSEQIQISFHDVSYHHSITIDNKTDKYSVGDLSLSAIALGSSQTGKLCCILYQSWDSNMKEWTINTENNEKIELVTLGGDFLAVATSQRFIRLMSLSGIQQRIIRLQGPIVSMSSYQNHLWMIHHSTQGLPKEQAMSYVLLDIENDHYSTGSLPLTPKTKLSWMGFSDSGKCYYLEKSGHLSMLRHNKGNQLEPLLISNLKQEAEKNTTNYWLLGINDFDGKVQVRVIELRGQSFPDLVPWPLVSIISLPLALYQIDTEKSQLESDYLKMKLFTHSTDEEDFCNTERQCLIKMFALSCKSNREYRAFEICQLMDSIALQLAVKYATKSGKITLAQKITDELIEQKKEQEEKQKEIQRSSSPPPPLRWK
ncbi:unnamed protein product [Adineta ricciae]|uniref:Uncharacterized protein n=2 Tax=Adineta ricciae TaxID=249248 RepID=A0A815IRC7_ADIRI|nr:unnamed protein product [Adineta ricciae]